MNTPRLLDLADGGAITLLHGSRSPGLLRLSAAGSRLRNPFGPAVYLTTDPVVATCYTGREGGVYRVRATGNPRLTLDLNLPFRRQTVETRTALAALARINDVRIIASGCETRTMLEGWAESPRDRAIVNTWLKEIGIWMIYGEIDGYENSGLCDRGLQFAVLDDSQLEVLDCMAPDAIYHLGIKDLLSPEHIREP